MTAWAHVRLFLFSFYFFLFFVHWSTRFIMLWNWAACGDVWAGQRMKADDHSRSRQRQLKHAGISSLITINVKCERVAPNYFHIISTANGQSSCGCFTRSQTMLLPSLRGVYTLIYMMNANSARMHSFCGHKSLVSLKELNRRRKKCVSVGGCTCLAIVRAPLTNCTLSQLSLSLSLSRRLSIIIKSLSIIIIQRNTFWRMWLCVWEGDVEWRNRRMALIRA